jgi:SecD/SecF fusion protein
MIGKGYIRFFFFALLFVCIYQIILVFPTNKVEKAAEAYGTKLAASAAAGSDKEDVAKIARARFLDSMSTEQIFSIPYVKKFTYTDLKKRQLAMGLDLKGGMSVMLQVDLRDLLLSLSGNTKDPEFIKALDNADARLKSGQADYVALFADEFKKVSNGKTLASVFSKNEGLKGQVNPGTADGSVIATLRQKANETVTLTYQRLKERIDEFGVVQPNVSVDASRDLILVELPGIDNPQRARNFLQATAKLDFWDVYRFNDPGIMEGFAAADSKLKALVSSGAAVGVSDSMRYTFTYDSLGNKKDSSLVASTNQGGGPLSSLLDMNASSGQGIKYSLAVMGTAEKNKINTITEYLGRPEIKSLFPADLQFKWSRDGIMDKDNKASNRFELFAIRTVRPGDNTPRLEGDNVIGASPSPDPRTGEMAVSLKMNNTGARIWGEMTTKAAQDNNREIAIVLDDKVVSAPRVINPILTGDSQITGSFNLEGAQDLSTILEIGKLPAKTTIIQESLVGPTLGKENISNSWKAGIFSFLGIMAFMVFYYAGGGVISIIALIANIIFILGAMASYGTVLTLPGIAGIVLTMGMAVDCNVIIYERIREELEAGKALIPAIADGFRHGLPAIIDSQATSIITALVLLYFGLGPIKGFAVVLIIGILLTLFTNLLWSRMLIDWWTITKGNTLTFWTKSTKHLFKDINVDWIGNRRIGYYISSALLIAGAISFFVRGFDLGVDFTGGYTYNVQFDPSVQTDGTKIKAALTPVFGSEPVVKAVDTKNTFNITTKYLITENGAEEKVLTKLHEGLKPIIGSTSLDEFKTPSGKSNHVTSFTKVGPTVADDIKGSAFWSTFLTLGLIFLYLFIRFSHWQFSLGAVIALLHDVLGVLAIFTLLHGILPFPMEIDQAFIAAILTVVGYSVNDTVIVFDRIREFIKSYNYKSKKEVFNSAINMTLSRTVITSGIHLLTIIVLFAFGGGAIRGFAFALFVGIVFGTYSSVFIASSLVVDLYKGDTFTAENAEVIQKETSSTAKVS